MPTKQARALPVLLRQPSRLFENASLHRWLLATLFVAAGLLMTARMVVTGSAMRGDGVYYFMQLRSLVVDHDFDFANEYDHFFNARSLLTGSRKISDIPEPHPVTHRLPNKYPIGTALALAPFYGLWHALTGVAEWLGFHIDRSGYGAPYQWAAAAGSCFYGFLCILLIYALGRRVTTADNALVTAVAMWLATPLIYYTIVDPLFSHAVSSTVVTALVYAWWSTRSRESASTAALIGAIAGVAGLVRFQDVLFLLVPAGDALQRWVRGWKSPAPAVERLRGLLPLVTMVTAAAAVLSLQMLVNARLYGSPWSTGYGDFGSADLTFPYALSPKLLYTLFSTDCGLLLYAPVLVFGIVGSRALLRRDPAAFWLLATSFGTQWYIVSAWGYVSQGGTFGNRILMNCTAVFAVGMLHLLADLNDHHPRRRRLVYVAVALCIALNGALGTWTMLSVYRQFRQGWMNNDAFHVGISLQ